MSNMLNLTRKIRRQQHSKTTKRQRHRERRWRNFEQLETRHLLATITVNSAADLPVDLTDDVITLRDAIEAANTNVAVSPGGTVGDAGADTIEFDGALANSTITLTEGDLRVTESLTVQGLGATLLTVSGGNNSRVFDFGSSGTNTFNINDLTVSDGNGLGGRFNTNGGGILLTTSNNTLNVNRSVISENASGSRAGAAILVLFNANLNINDSAVVNNGNGEATIQLQNTSATITNSTFSGNSSARATIWVRASGSGTASATLTNATFADNQTGAVFYSAEGSGATANIAYRNSVFSDNAADNFRLGGATGTINLDSQGTNILDDASGDPTPDPSDQLNTDPRLMPLTLIDGALVHPLRGGSPATDAGNDAFAPASDQRGQPRFDGDGDTVATSDIGAYEIDGVIPNFPWVDADNDGVFNVADGDVLLDDGETSDGSFDTAIPEGPDYTVAIAGAGLGLAGPAIANTNLAFHADGLLTVLTDLSSTSNRTVLNSRTGSVAVDGSSVEGRIQVDIDAGQDVYASSGIIRGVSSASDVMVDAGRDIEVKDSTLDARRNLTLRSTNDTRVVDLGTGTLLNAGPFSTAKVLVQAGGNVNFVGGSVDAAKDVELVGSEVRVDSTTVTADSNSIGKIEMRATATDVVLSMADLSARKTIELEATAGGVTAIDSVVQAALAGFTSVLINAGTTVFSAGSNIFASAVIDIDAGADLLLVRSFETNAPSMLSADVYSAARVNLNAGGTVNADNAIVDARKDIAVTAGMLRAIDSTLTADGHNSGKIDLHATDQVNLTDAELNARREVVIQSDTKRVIADDSVISASNRESTVLIDAGTDLDASDAQIEAGKAVTLIAGEALSASASMIKAAPDSLGKVEMTSANTMNIEGTTIEAHKSVDIDAGAELLADGVVIKAEGRSNASIDLNAGAHMELDGAELRANKSIVLEAVDSILANSAKLLAQENSDSTVRVISGESIDLIDTIVRAQWLIDLIAADVANLSDSSIGITRPGQGDICVTATSIVVENATLTAPDDTKLDGLVSGIPSFIGQGTLPKA